MTAQEWFACLCTGFKLGVRLWLWFLEVSAWPTHGKRWSAFTCWSCLRGLFTYFFFIQWNKRLFMNWGNLGCKRLESIGGLTATIRRQVLNLLVQHLHSVKGQSTWAIWKLARWSIKVVVSVAVCCSLVRSSRRGWSHEFILMSLVVDNCDVLWSVVTV